MGDELMYEATPASEGRRWRKIPRLTAAALRLLWQADRRSFVIAAGLQLGSGAGFAVQLLVGKRVLDELVHIVETEGSLGELVPWIVMLAVVSAAVGVALELTGVYRRLLAERGMRHMEGLAHEVAVTVDLEAFEHPSFFDRLTRATWQGAFAALEIAYAVVDLAGAAFGVIGVGLALLVLEPLLVPVVVAIYVPLWIAAAKNNIHGYNFTFGNTSNDRERSALEEVMFSRRLATEVHAYDLGGFLIGRWHRLYDIRIASVRKLIRGNLIRGLAANAASSVLRALMYGLLIWMLVSGRMSVTAAGAAAAAAALLTSRLTQASSSVTRLGAQVLHLDDFTSFATLRDQVAARRANPSAPDGFDELMAESLSFRYPGGDRDVLADISIRIRRGEVVALVGENGAGKTTLAKVLAGLYRPTEGTVRWDGTDIADYDPRSVHDRLVVIFQDFMYYPLSAADNIAVANPDRAGDRAAIRAAAKAAGADEFLTRLPRRYETPLTKDFASGTELSGGQWQRVALARAFFRDAPFVVLDEPTAALDARAEYELFRSLGKLATGKAVLLISHRFSSVRDADRIYVLRDGRVIEEGTHDDLIRAAGHYAELYELQAAAYAGAPAMAAEHEVATAVVDAEDTAAEDDSDGSRLDDEPAYRTSTGEPLRWTELPSRMVEGLRMAWAAGRAPLLWALAAQLATGAAAGALVIVTRDVVQVVLTAGREAGVSVGDVAPALVALVALTSVLGFATAATHPAAQMLSEVSRRRFVALTLDTANVVDYERFESAGFHDQLGRARRVGVTAPQMVASGFVYLGSAVFAVTGSAIALASIEPVLVPVLLFTFVPIWVATSRFAGAMYSMSLGHTPKDRMRQRLKLLLTGREPAAEIRALGAAVSSWRAGRRSSTSASPRSPKSAAATYDWRRWLRSLARCCRPRWFSCWRASSCPAASAWRPPQPPSSPSNKPPDEPAASEHPPAPSMKAACTCATSGPSSRRATERSPVRSARSRPPRQRQSTSSDSNSPIPSRPAPCCTTYRSGSAPVRSSPWSVTTAPERPRSPNCCATSTGQRQERSAGTAPSLSAPLSVATPRCCSRTWSAIRWRRARTSASATSLASTIPTPSSLPRSALAPTSSSQSYPTATTQCSPASSTTAPTCLAVSGSALRSRGRCSATPPSSYSMSRRHPSTPAPSATCS